MRKASEHIGKADSAMQAARRWEQAGNFKKAEAVYKKLLRADPYSTGVLLRLSRLNQRRGDLELAETQLKRALEIRPEFTAALLSLAELKCRRQHYETALQVCGRAQQLGCDEARLHTLRGFALYSLNRLADAATAYQRTLQLEPNSALALTNLATVQVKQGSARTGIETYRQALASMGAADPVPVLSCLMLALNYSADATDAEVAAEHRRFGQEVAARVSPVTEVSNRGRQGRRPLRVGYVSPDLYAHSVAYFFESLLCNHDPSLVNTYCYSDVRTADETTARLRRCARVWRDTHGLADEQVAKLVQRDQIDILVDLAGHMAGNRLLVFARRPAPIQVTYAGYPNTTGLDAMDYRMTDGWADPAGEEVYHVERLLRLDRCFLAYSPSKQAPEVGAAPCVESGFVTFASFNNTAKVTEEVVALWSRVLMGVPGSRLVVKAEGFGDHSCAAHYTHMFARHGVDPGRLTLLGRTQTPAEHLALYGQVDIALDTFPYNGTTTSCEALWMGVPVITLVGRRHRARVGLSLLRAAGLEELVADSAGAYVASAVALAGDRARLVALRNELRDRLRASELLDGVGLARAVEAAYQQMWHELPAGA